MKGIVLKPGDRITVIFDGKPYEAKILWDS